MNGREWGLLGLLSLLWGVSFFFSKVALAELPPWTLVVGRFGIAALALVAAEFRYAHPRTGADVEIAEAIRVPRDAPFVLKIGARVSVMCWGVMPSWMVRHPVLIGHYVSPPS